MFVRYSRSPGRIYLVLKPTAEAPLLQQYSTVVDYWHCSPNLRSLRNIKRTWNRREKGDIDVPSFIFFWLDKTFRIFLYVPICTQRHESPFSSCVLSLSVERVYIDHFSSITITMAVASSLFQLCMLNQLCIRNRTNRMFHDSNINIRIWRSCCSLLYCEYEETISLLAIIMPCRTHGPFGNYLPGHRHQSMGSGW